MNEITITKVESMSALEALNRSEIDVQISTAKAYPRDMKRAVNNVVAMACMDEETASSCFYHLSRKGSDGKDNSIDGESVRFAEILVANWGNIRAQARVVGNDGKFITAQGVCHDLETNSAISTEVKVRITYKNGATYNDDMQNTAGNSACAKAFRNAVFKCIPKAVVANAIKQIRAKAVENNNSDLTNLRAQWIEFYKGQNVSIEKILKYLGKDSVDSIDGADLVKLQGVYNAVRDGQTSYDTEFNESDKQEAIAEKAQAKSNAAREKAAAAVKAQG